MIMEMLDGSLQRYERRQYCQLMSAEWNYRQLEQKKASFVVVVVVEHRCRPQIVDMPGNGYIA